MVLANETPRGFCLDIRVILKPFTDHVLVYGLTYKGNQMVMLVNVNDEAVLDIVLAHPHKEMKQCLFVLKKIFRIFRFRIIHPWKLMPQP